MSETSLGRTPDIDTLKADIEQLRAYLGIDRWMIFEQRPAYLASLRDHGRDLGAAKGGEARGLLEEKVHQLQSEVDRIVAEVRRQGLEAQARLERNVHERPLTSLAIAFGVGFIAAKILR